MQSTISSPFFDRVTRYELPICLYCNDIENRAIRGFFGAISEAGNGALWLAFAVCGFLVEGAALGTAIFLDLLATLIPCLLLYKFLKSRTARPRPCAADDGIRLTVDPLDVWSFPSGHTLHAVAFTVVLAAHSAILFSVALPFAILIAMSRVVLGLHYPTDVLAGASLGGLIAYFVLLF